jgi:hypothetical protein
MIPSHVHCEANKVVDKLANIGVYREVGDLECNSTQHPDHPILMECIALAGKEDSPLDGVTYPTNMGTVIWVIEAKAPGNTCICHKIWALITLGTCSMEVCVES